MFSNVRASRGNAVFNMATISSTCSQGWRKLSRLDGAEPGCETPFKPADASDRTVLFVSPCLLPSPDSLGVSDRGIDSGRAVIVGGARVC